MGGKRSTDDFFGGLNMNMPDNNNNNNMLPKHHIINTGSKTHFVEDHPSIGFQGYIVETSEPFLGFHHITIAYCLMAFVLMYPFVLCGWQLRESRKRRQAAALQQQQLNKQKEQDQQQQQPSEQPAPSHQDNGVGGITSPPGSEIMQSFTGTPKGSSIRSSEATGSDSMDQTHTSSNNTQSTGSSNENNNQNNENHHTTVVTPPRQPQSLPGSICGGGGDLLDKVPSHDPVPVTPTTTKSTLHDDADASLSSDEVPMPPPVSLAPPGLTHRSRQSSGSSQQQQQQLQLQQQHRGQQQQQPQHSSQVASGSGIHSRNGAGSAATTGRLYAMVANTTTGGRSRTSSAAAWPRHKHSRRPSGDPSWQWRRAIQTERRHQSRCSEHQQLQQQQQQQLQMAASSQFGGGGTAGGPHNRNNNNNTNNGNNGMLFGKVMSDLANHVLDAEQDHMMTHSGVRKHHPPPTKTTGAAGIRASTLQYHQQQMQAKPKQQMMVTRPGGPVRQRSGGSSARMMRRPSQSGSARSGSVSVRSYGGSSMMGSAMSSIFDDITPLDAADADDPGKVRAFPTTAGGAGVVPAGLAVKAPWAAACCTALEPWLDVAEPNDEWKRLLGLAIPMTLGSMVEPLSRCILVGILSHWVGTYAMVAYLLVNLLYRMTGEILSVAVTDAESALVQMALTSTASQEGNNANNNGPTFTREGYHLAGQYVQLSCLLQFIVVGTVLFLWHCYIENVVVWWVDSADMASLAKSYYEIILILFLAQALYRAFTVPCHMRGAAHTTFETAVDIFVTAATLITSVVVLSQIADVPGEYPPQGQEMEPNIYVRPYSPEERQADSRTALTTVAWVQVTIGIAACVLKMAFCIVKGWLGHFESGLVKSVAVLNFGAVCNLLLSSIPLIMGSFLELGEVDLLTLFVQFLGPAEVAAWAVMGSIWDVLEASTEGTSEAAAVRVAYHLSASQPVMAKKVAHKALFWTVVGSLVLSSILLLSGRHLVVALTVDYTLQHLLNDLLGLMALANLSMAFAQVCWGLVGAQGRFNLATLVILVCRWLVTMPLSMIFIFAMNYDEVTLAGAVAAGYATSASTLACILFSSDWNDVAQALFMQGLLVADDDDDDFSFGDYDDESSDDSDSDDGFGVGAYPSNKKSMDDDEEEDVSLRQSTEPTSRTETVTGSGVNSGASGINSGVGSVEIRM